MKKLALASAIMLSACTTAFAESKGHTSSSTEAVITDHFSTIVREIPHNEKVCKTVDVPIYGNSQMNTEGAILGGIIGGVLGNQIGKGGGKNAATGVGAMAGAIIGGQGKKDIIGYKQETRCHYETTYSTQEESVYDYSTITFTDDGRKFVVRFVK
jgi:uncharacterized protein YcfJ